MRPHWLTIESYGLIIVLISAIVYAIAGAFVKLGHVQGNLPSTQLVFSRGIFQGSLVVISMYFCTDEKERRIIQNPFGSTRAARRLVMWRGILGGAGFLFDYHCMAVLPLGDAMTLMSMYPFLTIFLARFYLGEEVKPLHMYVTVASVSGAVLIAQPTFLFGTPGGPASKAPLAGYITGVLGSCCLASILILIRKAGTIGVHTLQLLLSWALCGIVFSLVFGGAEGQWRLPSSRLIWWYVFGVCSVGAAAHFLLNYAGKLAPAGLVSVVRSSDIMWAYACEILIFQQTPNIFTWIGVVLVLGSLVAIGFEKLRESRTVAMRKVLTTDTVDMLADEGDLEKQEIKADQ
jgi:drug/metabolite transporter (DMT)-like permease